MRSIALTLLLFDSSLAFAAKANRFSVDLALAPFMREQQIENPSRDDRVVREVGVVTRTTFSYAFVPWLEAGLYVAFDAGSGERTNYSRPAADGTATTVSRSAGAYWELWTGLFVRGVWGPAFFEFGWSPLVLRGDDGRADLASTTGDTSGTFRGNPFIAFMLAAGARVPIAPNLELKLILQFRIRYLSARGGDSLEASQNFGQMHLWPYIGLGYRF